MTTTNNHLTLIDQVGGIEKAKQLDEMLQKHGISEEWKISIINGMWHRSSVGFTHKDLRTAIAQHESNNHQETYHCNNSGNYEKRFNPSEVIKQLESDHVTDIRNHISPNIKVINHG